MWLLALACTDVGITVTDRPPTAAFVAPATDAAFDPAFPVAVCLLLADEDEIDALRWVLSTPNGPVATEADTQASACSPGNVGFEVNLGPTDRALQVLVIDTLDQTGEASVAIEPRENAAPTCNIVAEVGDVVTFRVSVQDADDALDRLEVVASIDDTEVFSGNPDQDGDLVFEASVAGGSHEVVVDVRDAGRSGRCGAEFEVVPCPDADADGWDVCEGDCDDTDPAVRPDAAEVFYDGEDQNCDGSDDFDADGDGDVAAGFGGSDCDDTDAAVYPGAPDLWYDGTDSDCGGDSDYDADADGFDAAGYGCVECDCDDLDAAINPAATEIWYDGVDQTCDGNDDDQDGDGAPVATDCDDTDPSVSTATIETRDGVDNDCDGHIDEGLISAGDLVITEIQYDPAAVSDLDGEWFEVFNPTSVAITMNADWTIQDNSGGLGHSLGSTVSIPSGGYAVFGANADRAANNDVPVDYEWGTSLSLSDTSDRIQILFDDPTLSSALTVDQVNPYSVTGTWPGPASGTAIQLGYSSGTTYYTAAQNGVGGNWCAADVSYGVAGSDYGTPGADNTCP